MEFPLKVRFNSLAIFFICAERETYKISRHKPAALAAISAFLATAIYRDEVKISFVDK